MKIGSPTKRLPQPKILAVLRSELNESQALFYETLAKEYAKETNIKQAIIALGLVDAIDMQEVEEIMDHPYFKGILKELLQTQKPEFFITKNEIIFNLKMLAVNAEKDGEKIAAWSKLGKYMGMDVEFIRQEITTVRENDKIADNMTVQQAAEAYARKILGKKED